MASDTAKPEQIPSEQLREAAAYFGKLADRMGTLGKRVEEAESISQSAEEQIGEAREELINAEHDRDEAVDRLRALEQYVDDMRLGLRTPAEVIAYSRDEAWSNWHEELHQVA